MFKIAKKCTKYGVSGYLALAREYSRYSKKVKWTITVPDLPGDKSIAISIVISVITNRSVSIYKCYCKHRFAKVNYNARAQGELVGLDISKGS